MSATAGSPPPGQGFVYRVLVGAGLVLLLVVLALFAWRVADLLLYAFAGVLVASFLLAVTDLFKGRLRLPHGLALALALVLVLGFLILASWLIGGSIAQQASDLVGELPRLFRQVEDQLQQFPWYENLRNGLPAPQEAAGGSLAGQVLGTASSLGTGFANLLLVVFVGIFLASSPGTYRRGVLALVPRKGRARANEVLGELGLTLRHWLLGQAISMAIIGTFVGLGLTLLGMPMALVLGLLAGLLEFVPFVGPIAAAVPALLIALGSGADMFLYVLLLYVLIQQLEGNVIMPLVQRRTVDLPPALTIVAVLVMERLFGFVGLFVATPLLALALVLVKMLYVHDALGDPVELPGGASER